MDLSKIEIIQTKDLQVGDFVKDVGTVANKRTFNYHGRVVIELQFENSMDTTHDLPAVLWLVVER